MIDFSLEDDIFITEPICKFVQEIDVLFNTPLTSVLGSPGFGSDFERFQWRLGDCSDEISEYARDKIQKIPEAARFAWDTACAMIQDDSGEMYYYLMVVIALSEEHIIEREYIIHNYNNC